MIARITAAEVIAAVRRVAVDSCGWWDWAAETCGCLGSTIAADHTSAALRAEVEKHLSRITEERDEARAEAERLRDIVEGRTTPPTDEEITAHAAAGGSWVVGVRPVHTAREAREVRDVCERRAVLHEETPPGWPPYRWLAFDDHGRPCAWPTVTP